ncbi:vacuolar-processing enzyme-like [Populus alba x Populus x berolinensis]|nr:vacuolar-processing enzyme-like [Populus alba x Populus x berolinensis]
MFEGLLPSNWSIYAITAANGEESSYGIYCPGYYPAPPPEFLTCLGDVFSISWMEDSDLHDMSQETLQQQYEVVRRRTGYDYEDMSHVMQYGNMELSKELLSSYVGTNAANDNYATNNNIEEYPSMIPRVFDQREATLLHFWHKYQEAPDGSDKKVEAHRDLLRLHSHIRHVDRSLNHIASTLFGDENAANAMKHVRPSGQPLVDDWDCLKGLVEAYEKQCGGLSWYGKKYTRVIANMCNAGINVEQMIGASTGACSSRTPGSLQNELDK